MIERNRRRDLTVSMRHKDSGLSSWTHWANRRERQAAKSDIAERIDECDERHEQSLYMWEPGYRDDMENVLGMEPSCNCRTCGRFLPAKESDPYESLGYPSMTPVAHVDHSNRPCIGSPIARPWMYLQ